MPQRPIRPYWKERIRAHVALAEQRNETPSDKRIREVLMKEADAMRDRSNAEVRADADWVPSERSISRIRKAEWPRLREEDRAQYRNFLWPESMERGDLPWEASAAALELLREGEQLLGSAWQPPVQAVEFFWRVDQAAHDAPFWIRMGATMLLMMADSNRDSELTKAVQWFLAYRPWRTDALPRYKEAIARRSDPIPAIPEDLPLYGITEPILNRDEFLANVRKLKLGLLDKLKAEQ